MKYILVSGGVISGIGKGKLLFFVLLLWLIWHLPLNNAEFLCKLIASKNSSYCKWHTILPTYHCLIVKFVF